MKASSFTDEQLINLVDNFILKETEYTPDDFTGGSIQSTYSKHTDVTNHSVYIFFGYDDKKNSISVKKKITANFKNVWYDAISCKIATIAAASHGNELNELNELMNVKNEKQVGMVSGNRYEVSGNRYEVEVIGMVPLVRSDLGGSTVGSTVGSDNSTNIIKSVIDHLNALNGTSYKSNTKSTVNLIKSLLKDGYTETDLKLVVTKKVNTWKKDRDMAKYIRPETLFGNKFESYLNEQVGGTLNVSETNYDEEETI